MKRLSLSLLIIIVAIGSYFYFNSGTSDPLSLLNNEWETFELNSENKLTQHKTTQKEINDAKLVIQKAKRLPASINKNAKRKPFLFPGQKLPAKISYKNKISPNWKEKLAPSLMRFLDPKTKLFIKKEQSLIVFERGIARYTEKVLVKFQTKAGRHYSYNALVDSETGHIIKTWNKLQHEGIGHEKIKFKLN